MEKSGGLLSYRIVSMSLRVGIAGYGLAGRYFHAPLLKGCGFEVVAIQTRNPERSAHALSDFPNTTVVATIEELVAQKLDLVVVASANLVHAQHAVAAIEAGIPVVIDKPMGRTFIETKEIIDAGNDAGVGVTTFLIVGGIVMRSLSRKFWQVEYLAMYIESIHDLKDFVQR